jgi:hypothetical protein
LKKKREGKIKLIKVPLKIAFLKTKKIKIFLSRRWPKNTLNVEKK